MRKSKSDFPPGTLDMLILQVLKGGPCHGYAIVRSIQELTEEVLCIEEGALYPALHRLEERGDLDAEWGRSENNRRARYYNLTRDGRARLKREVEAWGRMTEAVDQVLAANLQEAVS